MCLCQTQAKLNGFVQKKTERVYKRIALKGKPTQMQEHIYSSDDEAPLIVLKHKLPSAVAKTEKKRKLISNSSPPSKKSKYSVQLPSYERIRFIPKTRDMKDIVEQLDRDGVVIVPSFFSEEKCKSFVLKIMKDLESHVPGFIYDDENTWRLLPEKLKPTHGMIIQQFGLGWLQSVVDIRTHVRFHKFFTEFWRIVDKRPSLSEQDMLSSADALCVSLKPKPSQFKKTSRAGYYQKFIDWLHWDRAPRDPNFSVQGFLNLEKGHKDESATFTFLVNSHKYQKNFFDRFGSDKRFNLLENQDQLNFYTVENSCSHYALLLEPGDFVLWDSRLVHQGRPPVLKQDTEHVLKRCIVYVSYQPTYYATKKDKKNKVNAFMKHKTTTHNAGAGVQTFNTMPRAYTKEQAQAQKNGQMAIPLTKFPVLDQRQANLFGIASSSFGMK